MKAVIYVRSAKELQGVNTQFDICKTYIKENGWDLYGIYKDEGYSGLDDERPAYKELLEDAKLGEFDAIVISHSSKFSREQAKLLDVVSDLKKCGVKVVSARP